MNELPTPSNPFFPDSTSVSLAPLLRDLFYWPGDWAIYLAARYLPAAVEPLGFGSAEYGGEAAMILAFVIWLLVALLARIAWLSVRGLARTLWRHARRKVSQVRWRVHMARRFAKSRAEQPVRRAEPAITVGEWSDLRRVELLVLELHARVTLGYALSVTDVAEAMRTPKHQIQSVLDHLQRMSLLQATVGGHDGETAYTLTSAGRIVLRHLLAKPKAA